MGIRASRPHNPTKRQFLYVADKIAQGRGYKDHAEALTYKDKDGKIPTQKPTAKDKDGKIPHPKTTGPYYLYYS